MLIICINKCLPRFWTVVTTIERTRVGLLHPTVMKITEPHSDIVTMVYPPVVRQPQAKNHRAYRQICSLRWSFLIVGNGTCFTCARRCLCKQPYNHYRPLDGLLDQQIPLGFFTGPFVQWLGRQVFILETGVRFSYGLQRCVSSVWLEYLPVTQGVMGSSPIRTANL